MEEYKVTIAGHRWDPIREHIFDYQNAMDYIRDKALRLPSGYTITLERV
jgi:hypothetical protein